MSVIVFIPGIMGCRLSLKGEEIWPPTLTEAIGGYKRVDKLMDPKARAVGVIEKVECFAFYGPILQNLNDIGSGACGAPKRAVVPFHYDWRKDLRLAAGELAQTLDALAADHAEIILVAHSMGGLLARWYLEAGGFEARPGWGKVARLITIATPHAGAPIALVRAMGLEATVGLSGGDTARLAASPDFPALYQLLPAKQDVFAWQRVQGGSPALNIYDPAVAKELGLGEANLAAAQAFRAGLDEARRPDHVRYHVVGASGHATATRVDIGTGNPRIAREIAAGDGAVPLWSAVLAQEPHEVTKGEHRKVLVERDFQAILYRLFDAAPVVAPMSDDGAQTAISVSVDRLTYRPGEDVEVLLLAARPREAADFRILLSGPGDGPSTQAGKLTWEGQALAEFQLTLSAPDQPGQYSLSVRGATHRSVSDETDVAVFVVEGDLA
ncbi:MAG: hypothetical protein J7521_07480 [Caulobacter sp.]|nr:hypothetical protein [Caulobacter sp.]